MIQIFITKMQRVLKLALCWRWNWVVKVLITGTYQKLNTATILSYMNNDYKNSWFVKNTFDGSEVKTIKEILAYNAPTTDAEDLAKIMKYLGIGE